MKLLMLVAAPALALCACLPTAALPPPAVVADATTIDERSALAIEVAYSSAGQLLEFAVDRGWLKGETARRADAIDARAQAAVNAARRAYDAGNADSYDAARTEAELLIADLMAAITGGKGSAR